MKTITHPIRPVALSLALGTALISGCAVYYPGGYYGDTGYATSAPPPPRTEVIGLAPWVGAVWITGRWIWDNQWTWRDGYWTRPPHRDARWQSGRWEHRGSNQWFWLRGRWH